jgi:ribosome biogenesis protein BRX1
MAKKTRRASAAEPPAVSSRGGCLIASTRGIRARHRHLLRDLSRLLPHGQPHSKVDTDEAGLGGMPALCEDNGCSTSLLLDARDPRRLYMWVAGCPDGPTTMFRVLNIHTVAELKLEARRVFGARNIVVFDEGFNTTADLRVTRAILARTFSVPRHRGADPRSTSAASSVGGAQAARHLISFSWLDGSIWLRVYRVQGHVDGSGALDVEEIGPRLVLSPIRIIASGFGGAILHSS